MRPPPQQLVDEARDMGIDLRDGADARLFGAAG